MVEEIIIEMAGRGFVLELSPHGSLLGFYARFFVYPVGEDDVRGVPDWYECGHGITVLEALEMAQQLAMGQLSEPVPGCIKFLP